MAGRMNLLGAMLLAVCINVSLAGTAAQAAETVPRYSFTLRCTQPLLGSRWQQSQHEVHRMFAALHEWQAAHPDSADSVELHLNNMNREACDAAGRSFVAYAKLVYTDPALEGPLKDWLLSLPGIDAESIKPEQVAALYPFEENPAAVIIVNGTSYHYPQDFSEQERNWFAQLACSNYPNQTMFIPLPDPTLLVRFGFSELLRATTSGVDRPIVIDNFSEEFDSGDLVIPPGMPGYFTFIPTHLVPEDEKIPAIVLRELESRVNVSLNQPHMTADYWQELDYDLTAVPAAAATQLVDAAGAGFMDWLSAYPRFMADGNHFGDCTMEPVSADGRPVQLTLRLSGLEQSAIWQLKERLAALGLEPVQEFGNATEQCMFYNEPAVLAEPGLLWQRDEAHPLPLQELQQELDNYIARRMAMLPAPAELSAIAEEAPPTASFPGVQLKLSVPSVAEFSHMQSWVNSRLTDLPRWESSTLMTAALLPQQNQEQEPVSGFVDINGTRYQYPQDFAGLDTLALESQLRYYQPGQQSLAIFESIGYGEVNVDPKLAAKFDYGDLALIRCEEGGLSIMTIRKHWDPGIDLSHLDLPPGEQPRCTASLPAWIADDDAAAEAFARRYLHNRGSVMLAQSQQEMKNPPGRRTIIANPVPSTELPTRSALELAELLSSEQKAGSLRAARQTWEVLLQWMDDTEGFDSADASYDGFISNSPVTFQANDFGGFVQQIQIGVAGATDEQLVELMDRIYLATGMRDIWAMGNLFPSLLLDDTETVNAAASPIVITTGTR